MCVGDAVLAAACVLRADTITMKSGELLEGEVQEWGHKVIFWDRYGDKIIYDRPEVSGSPVAVHSLLLR